MPDLMVYTGRAGRKRRMDDRTPAARQQVRRPSISDRGLGCCYAVIRWGLPAGIAFWGFVAWMVMR